MNTLKEMLKCKKGLFGLGRRNTRISGEQPETVKTGNFNREQREKEILKKFGRDMSKYYRVVLFLFPDFNTFEECRKKHFYPINRQSNVPYTNGNSSNEFEYARNFNNLLANLKAYRGKGDICAQFVGPLKDIMPKRKLIRFEMSSNALLNKNLMRQIYHPTIRPQGPVLAVGAAALLDKLNKNEIKEIVNQINRKNFNDYDGQRLLWEWYPIYGEPELNENNSGLVGGRLLDVDPDQEYKKEGVNEPRLSNNQKALEVSQKINLSQIFKDNGINDKWISLEYKSNDNNTEIIHILKTKTKNIKKNEVTISGKFIFDKIPFNSELTLKVAKDGNKEKVKLDFMQDNAKKDYRLPQELIKLNNSTKVPLYNIVLHEKDAKIDDDTCEIIIHPASEDHWHKKALEKPFGVKKVKYKLNPNLDKKIEFPFVVTRDGGQKDFEFKIHLFFYTPSFGGKFLAKNELNTLGIEFQENVVFKNNSKAYEDYFIQNTKIGKDKHGKGTDVIVDYNKNKNKESHSYVLMCYAVVLSGEEYTRELLSHIDDQIVKYTKSNDQNIKNELKNFGVKDFNYQPMIIQNNN